MKERSSQKVELMYKPDYRPLELVSYKVSRVERSKANYLCLATFAATGHLDEGGELEGD